MSRSKAATVPPPDNVRRALSGQMLTLDGVRGIAILLVLAHNLNVIAGPQSRPGHVIDLVDDLGWVGVQLFFVLSGFLITGILLDTQDSDNYYRSFFGRRVLRIFPLYYATLTVAFLVLPIFTVHHPDGTHQVWLWTYLSNWAEPTGRGCEAFPHFWSLAVEEQFYLVWPFVVRALNRRHLAMLCTGLFVAALAIRVGLRLGGVGPEPVYMWTICRMDALAAGALLATLLRMPRAAELVKRWRWPLGWAAIIIAVGGFVITRGDPRTTVMSQTIGYTILAAAFTVLVFAAVLAECRTRGALRAFLRFRPLRIFGTYSYGLYVFHTPLHKFVAEPILHRYINPEEVGAKVGTLYFVLATAATLVLAVLSYHLFEKPLLKLKRYFVADRNNVEARP
ncbi:MAG: acyltransferase [Deltaproteobacteria bacterium]|nr:acyltransferase [Deltaproteobacteria bacterium]